MKITADELFNMKGTAIHAQYDMALARNSYFADRLPDEEKENRK